MVFADEEEYNNFKILTRNKDLCDLLMKSGICEIQLDDGFKRDRIIFENPGYIRTDKEQMRRGGI